MSVLTGKHFRTRTDDEIKEEQAEKDAERLAQVGLLIKAMHGHV